MLKNFQINIAAFLSLLLLYSNFYSQQIPEFYNNPAEKKFIADSIKISGNDKTEEFIILRELTFEAGDSITTSILKFNRERIFSLNLFTKVEVYPLTRNEKTIVQIDVNESWYIYPIPFIRRADKSSETYSYGVNFTYKNFRGLNENLRAIISLGYDPYFLILYDNPVFFYEQNAGINVGLSYLNSQNKSIAASKKYGGDFKNRFYSASLSFYKMIDQFNILSFTTAFDYIKVPSDKYFDGISASGKNIDRTISAGAGYSYDSRDLKQFPQSGVYLGLAFIHKGFGINDIDYNLFGADYRQHEKLFGDLLSRWRVAFKGSFGRVVPYYDYSYLGYDENVRGRSFNKQEGNNLIFSSFELSYPILSEFNFSIKLPLIPQSLTSARIGIFITAFADAGHAFDNNYHLRIKDFYAGYGAGITILALPYNAIRFEYAVGDGGKGEFLIGTGFAF